MLTRRQRQTWILWRDGKLGTTDIARVLGVTPQTVNTTLRRIQKRLETAKREGLEAASLLEAPRPSKPTDQFIGAYRYPW